MRHILSSKRLLALLILIVFLFPSLACRVIDALQVIISSATEKCRTVSRAAYETASYKLGQVPETPEDPEAVAYQVCYVEGQVVSARMVASYATDLDDPADLPENDPGEDTTSSILAGTYIGDFWDVPPSWELVVAEFIIIVADDGTVTGTKKYQNERVDPGPNCKPRWENGHTTTINGLISGSSGFAFVRTDSYTIWDMSDCGGVNSHNTFESVCDTAQITITGNQMEIRGDGSEGCGFVYTATKQAAP